MLQKVLFGDLITERGHEKPMPQFYIAPNCIHCAQIGWVVALKVFGSNLVFDRKTDRGYWVKP
jgi:hypothetical protein